MKIIKLFAVATIITLFATACNNETDVVNDNNTVKDVEVVNNGTMLKFKDQETFLKTLEIVDKDTTQNFGIKTLYSIYDEAMECADEAYKTEECYKDYKAKYEKYLLFPEYKDDYSAYLPVSSVNLAKVLNCEGKVMIGEEIKDFRDIHSYEDLQKAGIAWIESEDVMLRSHTYETPYEYSDNGKFKIRVKINNTEQRTPMQTVFGTFPGYTAGVLHFEITYRFKGFLCKWYNHKSHLTFSASLDFKYNKTLPNGTIIENSYNIIHDSFGPIKTYETSSVDRWYYWYPLKYKGVVHVEYSGINKTWDVNHDFD